MADSNVISANNTNEQHRNSELVGLGPDLDSTTSKDTDEKATLKSANDSCTSESLVTQPQARNRRARRQLEKQRHVDADLAMNLPRASVIFHDTLKARTSFELAASVRFVMNLLIQNGLPSNPSARISGNGKLTIEIENFERERDLVYIPECLHDLTTSPLFDESLFRY